MQNQHERRLPQSFFVPFSVPGNVVQYIQVFSSTSAPVASAFKKECSSYEALPDAPADVDQLRWWQHHQEQFPLLSYLARVVFAVPAASSKSERVFSVAGNLVTPNRNRLSPQQVIYKDKNQVLEVQAWNVCDRSRI